MGAWKVVKALESKVIFTNGVSFCACPIKDGRLDMSRADRRLPKGVLHKYESQVLRVGV